MGVIKNRTTTHGKNKKKKTKKKKNEMVIKQRASTILTFSLNIYTCDLKIFFSVCVRGCGGEGMF